MYNRESYQFSKNRVKLSIEEIILRDITELDTTNKKLLNIADVLTKTSFLNTNQIPIVISQLENQIRKTLNELINNIKQYYVDIDHKLKAICKTMGDTYVDNFQSRIKSSMSFHPSQKDALQILTQKVQQLENSLQKTQENQKKLVEVIDSICRKHQIQQQPTIIKNNPNLGQYFKKDKMEKNQIGTSQVYSIHQKLKGLIESQVSETRTNQQNQTYIKKIYSKNNNNLLASYYPKKSLKVRTLTQFKSPEKHKQSSYNNNHRYNFLINKLKGSQFQQQH